jgi:hypothetical protein
MLSIIWVTRPVNADFPRFFVAITRGAVTFAGAVKHITVAPSTVYIEYSNFTNEPVLRGVTAVARDRDIIFSMGRGENERRKDDPKEQDYQSFSYHRASLKISLLFDCS